MQSKSGRYLAVLLAGMLAASVGTARAADLPAAAGLPRPAAAGEPWNAGERARLAADLDEILAGAATLRGAHAGLLAVETATNRVLYARAADDAFVPASNFKLLTGSAALARLGPGFAFKTAVVASGPRLVLVGGGDALLGLRDLDAAAAAVASAGLGPIGEVDADASLYDAERYGAGWSWDDFPYAYSPVLTALCLEDNVVSADVGPGSAAGTAATIAFVPAVPLIEFENRAATGAAGSAMTLDLARAGERVVFTGSIALGAKPERIDAALPDPARYALLAFVNALAAHGVQFAPGFSTKVDAVSPRDGYRTIWTHDSAPLAQYLADFWYPSDNLIGEMLLKAMGVARSGMPGTAENGASLEADWLRSLGVDSRRVDISDGSGLSVYDRISPRTLVRILAADWAGPNRAAVLDALPVAGRSGTLRNLFRGTPAEGRVFAKTGTLRHARALSGYARPLRHGAITFSFMVDDWLGEDAEMDALRARLLSRLIGSRAQ